MYYYFSDSYSPSYNLATEEYLMKECSEDFFMLYRNRQSVIIGKHQDVNCEVNTEYTSRKNIDIFRRISGGGAVYHDLGNINYSFITTGCDGCLVDFPKYIGIMVKVLRNMGINAYMDDRNAVFCGRFKISGTACHVWRNRTIHHGTILFETDIDRLNRCLNAGFIGYKPGKVASVRSVVRNVKCLLDGNMNIGDFILNLMTNINRLVDLQSSYRLMETDLENIRKLESERYLNKQWNYNYQENEERLII